MPATPVENAVQQGVRVEWVKESTPGTPPSNPSWKRMGDYFVSLPGWSADASVEGFTPVGEGDVQKHFIGPEEHQLSFEWLMQRHFVDSNGNPNDPIGELLNYTYGSSFPTHTVVARRESKDGGNDNSGFRDYTVGQGCHPASGTIPGDPAESQPIALEAEYECAKVRSYVIHQPSSSTTVTVSNAGSNSVDVTIEDEGASTAETVTVSGGGSTTTTASFSNIDVIWANSEPDGKITVTDGSGTTLLEDGLAGTGTGQSDDGDQGIPPLGSGSHASAIGTAPSDYTFRGTSTTFGGGEVAARVHALDLTVEVEITREPKQTPPQSIDIGGRTVEVDFDSAGAWDTHTQHVRYLRGTDGDIVYTFPDGTVTPKNCQLSDVGDREYESGDANVITSNTFQAKGDPAVTVTHN